MKKFMEINTRNISHLRKESSSNLPVFIGTIEKVMKLYEEQRNDWRIRKVSFVSCIFYILLRVNRLLVVIAWAFFLATQLTTVSFD